MRAVVGEPRRIDRIRYRNVQKLILPLGTVGETVEQLLVLPGVDPVTR